MARHLLAALALGLAGLATTAPAVTLNKGDILVVDHSAAAAVLRIDPVTGVKTVISSGGNLIAPRGVALEANGDVLVSDSAGLIVRVDPATGGQTVVSSGGSLGELQHLVVEADGKILVVNRSELFRVDPDTGAQVLLSSGLPGTRGVAIEADDQILASGNDDIIRVDPVSGTQSIVSSGGLLVNLHGIAVEANGDIIVAVPNTPALIRVDPITGAQTILSTGGLFAAPLDVAVEADGNILAIDDITDAVIRVDPVSGAQSIVSSNGSFGVPTGIAVFPSGPFIPRLACVGFDGIGDTVFKITRPRAIPLRAELQDDGVPVTDLAAPPVLQVLFTPEQPAEPPLDGTALVLPVTSTTVGDQFFFDGTRWAHNLLTLRYSAPGTRTIRMISGDDQEYVINPTCEATYVIE